MAKSEREDVDWATAAEQSAEDDEAQTGSINAVDEADVDAAEHGALHLTGADGDDVDLNAVLDAIAEASDPEADQVVDEALEVPTSEDAEAVVNALEDADEEAAAEAEVDPYEAFKTELRMKPGKWYVIHSYAGFERRVKSNLENRIQSMDMQDYIFQMEVPMEDVVEIKNGQRKMVTRVRIPGYVLVRMDLNEDSWSVVRHTPGVTGFVGNAHNPTPLRFNEAFEMLKSLVQVEAAPAGRAGAKGQKAAARAIPAEVDFEIGETITIKEGSFAGLPGSISEINTQSGKLTVLVSLFERETPVELSFDQVTKL
ncbi:transcription termination/antitermination protein NusG [Gryllotalpicola protaetiae]|uniref:Transcription termination/antitermination protein NusG n=1 Tax=Gryllotalpicola protaetiae TaxID=2419771 RepID=A0A387BST2_9MICO|nr:transcription termination/antitermination protein NusG [Gryllotalpicola protaetiae]AYG04007.1 transcription termination/antitermination protein NusG [Gryllotalpicola protaetiae]